MNQDPPAPGLTEFEQGFLFAMAELLKKGGETYLVAQALLANGYEGKDCSQLSDYKKMLLRRVNGIAGLTLVGLESVRQFKD